MKNKCHVCKKTSLILGREGVYVWNYRGDKDVWIHACYDCFESKKREYLQNYAHIYTYNSDWQARKGTGYVKNKNADCYFEKKDQNGKILKQSQCGCCQPWEDDEHIPDIPNYANCLVCGKGISHNQIVYISKKPSEGEKYLCSLKCINSHHNSPKISENKGISTEMKVLGIVVLILVFVSGVVLGKISQKTKKYKK